jgi:hypothetical protein
MTASFIDDCYYGENSPMIALKTMDGDESLIIPEYEPEYEPEYDPEYDHNDVLQMVAGNKKGFHKNMLNTSIKKWFKKIYLYMDIPLLGLFADSGIDMESNEWWNKFVKCNGYMNFLKNYKYTVKNDLISCEKVDVLNWIIKHGCKYDFNGALNSACYYGHMECAKFCVENGANDFNDALRYACKNGHMECAKWCVENGANNFNDVLNIACGNGHLECAKFCVEKGAYDLKCALTYNSLEYACMNGYLECAKFCVENDAAYDLNNALIYSCENGQLECAKLCVENGANDFNNALSYACRYGQLECAKLCVENGGICYHCKGTNHEV